jgi:hypothetical protein
MADEDGIAAEEEEQEEMDSDEVLDETDSDDDMEGIGEKHGNGDNGSHSPCIPE